MQLTVYFEILTKIAKQMHLEEIAVMARRLFAQDPNAGWSNEDRDWMNKTIRSAREQMLLLQQNPNVASVVEVTRLDQVFEMSKIDEIGFRLRSIAARKDYHHDHWKRLEKFVEDLENFLLGTAALKACVIDPRRGAAQATEEIVEIELVDEGGGFTADRLAQLFETLDELHRALSELNQMGSPAVRIAYLDSGSGLFVGVKLDGKLVAELRQFFFEVWDRLADRDRVRFDRRAESVERALGVVARVEKMRADGLLTPDAATRISHKLTECAERMLDVGAIERSVRARPDARGVVQMLESRQSTGLLPPPPVRADPNSEAGGQG